jgi:peptidoglycan/LPS O-acetylase OafA/YrhL
LRHVPALDGIRGIAILLVMFQHLTVIVPITPGERYLLTVAEFGGHGVDLFFVLSGLLITGILLRTKSQPHYFRNFYARRTLRIFPLYYLIVGLCIAAAALPAILPNMPAGRAGRLGSILTDWPWYAAFASNFFVAMLQNRPLVSGSVNWGHPALGVTWSLAIEEQFYLVWAAVVFWLSTPALKRVCLVIIGTASILRFGLLAAGWLPVQVYVLTPTRVDALCWGALLAILMNGPVAVSRMWSRAFRVALPVAGIPILAIVFAGKWHPWGHWEQIFGYTAVGLVCASVVSLAFEEGRFSRIMSHPALRMFGKYSFGLYLIQWPVRTIIRDRWFGDAQFRALPGSVFLWQLVFYVVVGAAIVGVAMCSWHLWEKRWQALKGRFEAPRPKSEAAAA